MPTSVTIVAMDEQVDLQGLDEGALALVQRLLADIVMEASTKAGKIQIH